MENFKNPYGAKNVPEFWHRWHISLSSWFRDYLYIPLGGNRTSEGLWTFNIMTVFLLSGLWHGANWTFVIWGGLHGLYVVATKYAARWLPNLSRAPALLKYAVTFNLVSLAWIFFRAKTIASAFEIITGIFKNANMHLMLKQVATVDSVWTGVVCLAVFGLLSYLRSHNPVQEIVNNRSFPVQSFGFWRPALWFAVIVQVIVIGAPLNESAFIYFQF